MRVTNNARAERAERAKQLHTRGYTDGHFGRRAALLDADYQEGWRRGYTARRAIRRLP